MKLLLGAAASAAILILAVQAQGERVSARTPAAVPVGLGDWMRPLGAPAAPDAPPPTEAAPVEPDVVDAHWMALTMWGEARGQGEEAMRAVGHVILNRKEAGKHGAFVTDTVSAAWQFSCWNPGDPNLTAIMGIDNLPEGSREHRMWQAARRIAGEILSGGSADPTGGALFYHAASVAPKWSDGIVPIRQIGGHLFFRTTR